MKELNKSATLLLLNNCGIDAKEYTYLGRTCDNIKLRHKQSGKVVDIRY